MYRETIVYFLQKSIGVTGKHTDELLQFQEYFRGKNYQLICQPEQIESKIKEIRNDVEM